MSPSAASEATAARSCEASGGQLRCTREGVPRKQVACSGGSSRSRCATHVTLSVTLPCETLSSGLRESTIRPLRSSSFKSTATSPRKSFFEKASRSHSRTSSGDCASSERRPSNERSSSHSGSSVMYNTRVRFLMAPMETMANGSEAPLESLGSSDEARSMCTRTSPCIVAKGAATGAAAGATVADGADTVLMAASFARTAALATLAPTAMLSVLSP
eukprot:6213455-Pleurochrysis_carterae.AAC.6